MPVDVASAPAVAVARFTAQLLAHPAALVGYGKREQTRTYPLRLVLGYLRWKPIPTGGSDLAESQRFLLALSMLPGERRRSLAAVARRAIPKTLARREPGVRYPIALSVLAQAAVDLLDEVIALFDQALPRRESRAKTKIEQVLAQRARTGEDRQLMLEVMLGVLADVGPRRGSRGLRDQLGRQNLADAQEDAWADLPRDHGRLPALAAACPYLRQFTPDVLPAIDFRCGPGMGQLIDAVTLLCQLNRTGRRKVPHGVPTGSCPAATSVTWPKPGLTGTTWATGTTGNCACCSGCGTGCAPVTGSYPGPGDTPTPAAT